MPSQCHFCNATLIKKFKVRCSIPRCGKYYCVDCIHSFFDKEFQECLYKPDCWICYSCQKKCNCLFCNGLGSTKKSGRGRKKINLQQQAQPNIEKTNINIQENNLNNSKMILETQEDIFDKKQIEKYPPFMKKILLRKKLFYEEMKRQYQSKNQNIIQNSKPQVKIIFSMNKYAQKAIVVSQKQIEKLIGNTFKQYDQDENDFGIQIIDQQ